MTGSMMVRPMRTKEQIERDITYWWMIRHAGRNSAQRARAAKRLVALKAELRDLPATPERAA